MKKWILAALLPLLTGCVTPPLHDLQVARDACEQGNQLACADLPRLEAVRQAYNARVDADLLHTAADLAVIGAVVAPVAILAAHPHPHGPPPSSLRPPPLGHP